MKNNNDKHPTFTSNGITHRLNIFPNDNNTGWLISVTSFGGSGIATISLQEADQIVELFQNKPGPIQYDCEKHQKIGTCIECLL